MAPYVESLRGPAKILDYCDIDSQKWREYVGHQKFPISAGYWLEAIKLERRERILSRSFDLCTCATRAEVESLRQLGVTTRTDWFPNGVDTDFFAPGPEAYDPNFISFIGRMDYYPNQQAVMNFVRDVFPELRRLRPAIRFAIVGAEPSAEVRRLARIPGVTVTGSVPDVRPFVQRSALTVVPLEIARGTQNKILESMAMGVPVITSQCAADGVDALRQQHLLVASGVEEWVTAIRTVLDDPHQRQHLGSAGRDRMLSHHSWQAAMRRVDGLINTVMPQRQHAA
jgi:sugar transferase (PEP-CTERM/EpsH1 system associated)